VKKSERKRILPGERNTAVGVAWYPPEGWERIRAVAADPERLEDSYEEWLRTKYESPHRLAGA
jgi:hypothetical protein